MKKTRRLSSAGGKLAVPVLCALLIPNGRAGTTVGPSGWVSVEEAGRVDTFPLEFAWVQNSELPGGKGWVWQGGGPDWLTGWITLNPDPSIGFGLSVVDFGAPSTFVFSFSTPIFPTGPLTSVQGSLSGSLAEGDPRDGVSISPFGGPDIMVNSGVAGGPPINLGVDVGPGSGALSGSPTYTYGPYTEGFQSGPAGTFTSLTTVLSFTLSGGGDIATLSGSSTITAVPEVNGGVAVGALALTGMVAVRRYRKNRA